MSRPSADHADCRCGHQHRAHEHYRRGSDCALCTCARFQVAPVGEPAGGVVSRWLRRLRDAAV